MTGSKAAKLPIIGNVATGVPGLDAVLGGGFCEYSFNLIAGAPGAGKTTLAQQIIFANASRERPTLYFTVLGEPTVKMLRYQQQFSFFDPAKMADGSVRFVNLTSLALENNLDKMLEHVKHETEKVNPGVVVVDSFRS